MEPHSRKSPQKQNYYQQGGGGGSYNHQYQVGVGYQHPVGVGYGYSQTQDKVVKKSLAQKSDQQQVTDVIGFVLAEYERLEIATFGESNRSFKGLDNLSQIEDKGVLKAKLMLNLQNAQFMVNLYVRTYKTEFPLPGLGTFPQWYNSRRKPADADMAKILTNIGSLYESKIIEDFSLGSLDPNCYDINGVSQEDCDQLTNAMQFADARQTQTNKYYTENPDSDVGFREDQLKYDQYYQKDKKQKEKGKAVQKESAVFNDMVQEYPEVLRKSQGKQQPQPQGWSQEKQKKESFL